MAEESNELLVVDPEKGTVLNKIEVGRYPYTVILSVDEKTAYVSNQWSDNVSVIDLVEMKVTDTLNTGNGPAGLSLSGDGKFLYCVNSYSSDLSVIDLKTGEERKRLNREIILQE